MTPRRLESTIRRSSAACWAAVAAFAVLSVGLRLPFLSAPLTSDEGGYAYTAHWLARGLNLYRDLWFDRPQGIFLVYGAILRLFGESTPAIRLGAALWNAATVVAVFALGRRLFGDLAGLAAAAIFAIASASPALEGFTANGELFVNLPVVVSVLLAVARRPFCSGVALALAGAIKPTALPTVFPPLALILISSRSWFGSVRAAAGFLVAAAPFVAHGLLTDATAYWYAVVGFRVQSHSAFAVGADLARDFLLTAPSAALSLLPLWPLAWLGARTAGWRAPNTLFASSFLAGAVLAAAAGGYWYWHYYLGLLPPLSLLAGAGLAHLLRPAVANRGPRPLVRWSWPVASTAIAVLFTARLVGPTPNQTSWNLYRRPAYLASAEIAQYVRQHTAESDRIYAAFAQADLYHLSGRRGAGRHLYWTEINRVPGAFEEILAALDDPLRRPTYVVEIDRDLESLGRSTPFWARVEHFYAPEATIRGFTLYRRREF